MLFMMYIHWCRYFSTNAWLSQLAMKLKIYLVLKLVLLSWFAVMEVMRLGEVFGMSWTIVLVLSKLAFLAKRKSLSFEIFLENSFGNWFFRFSIWTRCIIPWWTCEHFCITMLNLCYGNYTVTLLVSYLCTECIGVWVIT